MRILFVPPMNFPLQMGGFERQVFNIYNGIIANNISVDWYNLNHTNLKDYDIIHFHTISPYFTHIANMALDYNKKIVITPMFGNREKSDKVLKLIKHASIIPGLFTPYVDIFELAKKASHIITLTQFERNRFMDVFDVAMEDISIIPNAIDDEFFITNDDCNINLPSKNYILTIGRIEPNKNQATLIKVAKKLGLHLIVVGTPGIGSREYYDYCKKISNDNITFWGNENNRNTLKMLYRHAQLTVIPSYSEMFPLVALESLSQNTPVICTTECGLYPTIMDGLYFSKPHNDCLTKAIKKILHHKPNSHLTNKIFNWQDIADQHINLYRKLYE